MSQKTKVDREQTVSGNQWLSAWIVRFLLIWVVVLMLTIPLPRHILPDLQGYYKPFFRNIYLLVGNLIANIHKPFQADLASDSTGMYLHYLCMAFLAAFAAWIWNYQKGQENMAKQRQWLRTIAAYFLSLELMTYGFSKLFLKQFYVPEANIAFTRLAELSPDILYWSSMGSAPAFSYVTGALEVLAALLLLFTRTRFLGALLSIIILSQVVMVNFTFDISVKLFSIFLSILSLIVLSGYVSRIKVLLVSTKKNISLIPEEQVPIIANKIWYVIAKIAVIILIITESLFLFASGRLHFPQYEKVRGAWNVQGVDTVDSDSSIRRVFIHSAGYFILEKKNEEKQDFRIQSYQNKQFVLISPETGMLDTLQVGHSSGGQEVLHLQGTLNRKPLKIHCHRIALENLPLYRHEFHWTSDGGF